MSQYRIFKSVYVDEYGKEDEPYFWIKKRKTFLGIPYWKSLRHYDGGDYTYLTTFDSYDDALIHIKNVLSKGIKTDEINTELAGVVHGYN